MHAEQRSGIANGFAIWIWLLVGLLASEGLRDWIAGDIPQLSSWVLENLQDRAPDLKTSCVRELRRLPAIGNQRAIQLSRARWEHNPELGSLELEDLPGIGPITAARVRHALKRSGGAPANLELVPAVSNR